MELHEFMAPSISKVRPSLGFFRDHNPPLPSQLFTVFDTDEGLYFTDGRLSSLPKTEVELESNPDFSSGYKSVRRTLYVSDHFKEVNGTFAVDPEDCREVPLSVYWRCPFNVFQYNRRKGDKLPILWRLTSYFSPANSLGHPPSPRVYDGLDFADKEPRVFWRGSLNFSEWKTPYSRSTLDLSDELFEDGLGKGGDRVRAVLLSQRLDCLDACIYSPTRPTRVSEQVFSSYFTDEKADMGRILRYRYHLCPGGNDVSSALYWIIGTQTIAFKVETNFEVIPDYFLEPWVHYIPISPGLHDLQDKFDFCEANPQFCREIIANANEAYFRLMKSGEWERAEEQVLDRYFG